VIKALNCDAKGTLSQKGLDLVPETNMVLHYYFVISLLIIKVEVVLIMGGGWLNFCDPKSEVIHLWVIQYFS
jgi:hypothetical protein